MRGVPPLMSIAEVDELTRLRRLSRTLQGRVRSVGITSAMLAGAIGLLIGCMVGALL